MDRAAYVEALKVERAGVAARPEGTSRAHRLKDIDAELARYAEQPGAAAPLETAVTPPRSRARRATTPE